MPSSSRPGASNNNSAVEEKQRLAAILRDPNETHDPPAYFEASSSTHVPTDNLTRLHDLPNINYRAYIIPGAQVSEEDGTTVVHFDRFSLSPDGVMRMVLQQAALPPKPMIHIKGNISFRGDPHFDLKLNASSLLLRDESDPWNYTKVMASNGRSSSNTLDIEQAVLRFCTEEASYKT